jgi:hypothetical protein
VDTPTAMINDDLTMNDDVMLSARFPHIRRKLHLPGWECAGFSKTSPMPDDRVNSDAVDRPLTQQPDLNAIPA